MDQTVVALSVVEVICVVVAVLIATIVRKYRGQRLGLPVFVTAVGASGYTLATVVRTFVSDPVVWQLLNNIRYPLGAIIAVGAFYIAAEFTQREQFRHPVVVGLFTGYVLINALISLTDPLHGLVIADQLTVTGGYIGVAGPLFWVHVTVGLGIGTAATGMLLASLGDIHGIYLTQTLILISGLTVLIGSFLWQSVAPIHPLFDIATVGIVTYCGLVLWGLFKHDLLETVPVSRQTLMGSMEDPVIAITADDTVVDLNPPAMELFDVDGDAIGRSLESLLASYPELDDGLPTDEEPRLALERNGDTRHYDLKISSVLPDDGPHDSFGQIIVFRDVTTAVERKCRLEAQAAQLEDQNERLTEEIERRKQREIELERTTARLQERTDQLERSRERYRSLFEHSPLVLWEEDLSEAISRANELVDDPAELASYLEAHPEEHRQLFETIEVVDVNHTAVEAYGASSKTELMSRLDEILTEQAFESSRYLFEKLLKGNRRSRAETMYRTLDGEHRYELVDTIVPASSSDDFSRVLLAGTDITKRKARERELQYQTALFEAVAESINAGVLVTSRDREILWHNRQFRELWGIPIDLLEANDDRAAVEYVLDSVADPEAFLEATDQLHEPPFEPHQMELQLADGRWFSRYTAPVTDDDETLYGLLTLTRDITDQKQYETRIETQNQWLERLAQVISHDLRTPLSSASKHLTLLEIELEDPPEPVEQSLADLNLTVDRLEKFTEHLPRMARESTNVESPVVCELETVARAAWDVVDPDALELVVEDSMTVRADPRRLQQVFENLLRNVAEHAVGTAESASTVWVGTHENGFYVADDGPGIRPEQGDEIFEYGMSTSDGSGIGLAIVRNIIEAHGWSITVDNRDGGGVRFTVETVDHGDGIERRDEPPRP